MGISITLSLFFAVVTIYVIIVDVFSILFRVTGMDEEKARFQTISLLTNSGFTTRESEIILAVPVRRKLARQVMLFGFAFSATVISIIVSVIASVPFEERGELWPVLVTVFLVFLIYLLARQVSAFKDYFNKKVETWAKRKMTAHTNHVILVDEGRNNSFVRVQINKMPESMRGKPFDQTGLDETNGIHVLFMERGNNTIKRPFPEMLLQEGDMLAMLGEYATIEQLFCADEGGASGLEEIQPPQDTPPQAE